MSRKFFFQQNDTKIKFFDEGVLILEQFFSEAMSFSKFASFVSKVTIEVGSNFFESLPPNCNTAKLRNECFSLIMLSLFSKVRADTAQLTDKYRGGGVIISVKYDFLLMLVNSVFKGEVKINIEVTNYAFLYASH